MTFPRSRFGLVWVENFPPFVKRIERTQFDTCDGIDIS